MEFLKKSFAAQTDKDFELVVVDGYPGRINRGVALEYLKQANVGLTWYGPPKQKSYRTVTEFASAMNTGLRVAKGAWAVFLHDYCFIPEDAVARWKRSIRENGTKCLISGFARRYTAVHFPQHLDHDISLWDNSDRGIPIYIVEDWVPKRFEVFYSAFPLEFMELVNGWDERADNHTTHPLSSITCQAFMHEYRLEVDRRLVCHMIDHRDWGEKAGTATIWNYVQQKEPEEPGWYRVSPNCFNLQEERRICQNG